MALLDPPSAAASAGERFRTALEQHRTEQQALQIVGTINAYSAIQAQQAGFSAIYLSGSGVAAASYGLPDLGLTRCEDVLEDVRRISGATALPLLVDIDTGWGAANIGRNIRGMISAGAAAVHIEDQVEQKRCGHRPNKTLVSQQQMVDRIKAAVDARTDPHFFIMARTDALAVEGLDAAIERAQAYIDAGADGIFAEAVTELEQYRIFAEHLRSPILANITEFGSTPLFSAHELSAAGCAMVLYPLSAFRAMSNAASEVYRSIRTQGHQREVINLMQSREDMYKTLDYYSYERQLDLLLQDNKPS